MLDSLTLQLRNECLRVLCEICGREALFPRSLPKIPLCYDKSQIPWSIGGFANVWMGEYGGHKVAVKVLRASLSNFEKTTKVGHYQKFAKVGSEELTAIA